MSSSTSTGITRTAADHCAAIILAAGKSTRMRSRLPKPLHPLCGLPLTRHVVEACRAAGVERVIVVVGHDADRVRAGLGTDLEYVDQPDQLGSGHAALCAEPALRGFQGSVLVLAGDVPLLRAQTLVDLVRRRREHECGGAMLTAFLDDPTGYGRVVRDAEGWVERIVEHKDATPDERAIREWNPSVYCFDSGALFDALPRVGADNAQGEYYLTDVVGLLAADGARVAALPVRDSSEVLGVNTRVELAVIAAELRGRVLRDLMLSGVTITDPASTYVDVAVRVGQDTVIEPQSHLRGRTVVGEECVIGPMTDLCDAVVGDRCVVIASRVDDSAMGCDVRVGPYANIRPGCRISEGARIGDFVELKNSAIGPRASAAHLSYIGDTDVGARANIGAGTITCNYDGYRKHRTVIGEEAFVGSHTTFVAPVTLGDRAMTAAGCTMTDDVPDDALAVARVRQQIRPGWAARWRAVHERRQEPHE